MKIMSKIGARFREIAGYSNHFIPRLMKYKAVDDIQILLSTPSFLLVFQSKLLLEKSFLSFSIEETILRHSWRVQHVSHKP